MFVSVILPEHASSGPLVAAAREQKGEVSVGPHEQEGQSISPVI